VNNSACSNLLTMAYRNRSLVKVENTNPDTTAKELATTYSSVMLTSGQATYDMP